MITETTFDLNAYILALEAEFNDKAFISTVWTASIRTTGHTRITWALFLTAIKYYKPHQPYHNLTHAKNVVLAVIAIYESRLNFLEKYSFDVLLAAMWHDAIYVSGSKFNEILSLKTMRYELEDLCIRTQAPFPSIGSAQTLIRLTKIECHLLDTIDDAPEELSILLDADLVSMAEENYYVFEATQWGIMREQLCKGVELLEEHKQKSRDFLKQFLAKKSIYRTPEAIEMWEAKARYNLTRYCYDHAS